MALKQEVTSPTSLSGSAAEDEEHSTTHNKAHGVIGPYYVACYALHLLRRYQTMM